MMVSIPAGRPLPIVRQLADGATGKFPRALVYDPAGVLVGTYDLNDAGNGLYQFPGAVMPPHPWVTAVHIVYDDAGHTSESPSHPRTSAVFVLTPPPVSLADPVDGAVTVQLALARANAMAAGRVVRTGVQYAYRNDADDSTLFTNENSDSERTPV